MSFAHPWHQNSNGCCTKGSHFQVNAGTTGTCHSERALEKCQKNEGDDSLEDQKSVPARGASITGIIPLTGAALIVCCSSLAILIGNIGFQGDDWWQFSWPYWHSFPNSIWEYAKASRRPIEGLYTVLSFEIFGLNRVLFTLSALLLSAGSCLLMGACLNRAFPGRKTLAVLAVFFAFLLTPLSNLIYMFHTDNSRLSMLLFWTSVLAFQHWAGASKSWLGLTLPVILYLAASLDLRDRDVPDFRRSSFRLADTRQSQPRLSDRSFVLRLGAGITIAFAAFVSGAIWIVWRWRCGSPFAGAFIQPGLLIRLQSDALHGRAVA